MRWIVAREPVWVTTVLALLCAGYLSVSHDGFDLLEEGYFATGARRVQSGALPYRDFSAPYTPAGYYLNAFILTWFGSDLAALRVAHLVARVGLLLGLYLAARQLTPPLFAALPAAAIVLVDMVPEPWSLHPAWWSAAATIAGVLAIARYLRTGRARYLFAAGAASGVGFAFKQNLPAFELMAAVCVLVVAERHLPPLDLPRRFFLRRARSDSGPAGAHAQAVVRTLGRARVVLQVAALVILPLAAVVLVHAYWSTSVGVSLVLPLLAVSVVAAARVMFAGVRIADEEPARPPESLVADARARELSFYARPCIVLAAFGAVTLPWLVVLLSALQGRLELVSSFVGEVDAAGFFLDAPLLQRDQLLALGASGLIGAMLALVALDPRPWRFGLAAVGIGGVGVLQARRLIDYAIILSHPPALWGAAAPAWSSYAETYYSVVSTTPAYYLPIAAFWIGLATFAVQNARWSSNGATRLVRFWYLASGAAMLLHQYPRMDLYHMVWSGGVLLVVGADVLHSWYRRLTYRALLPRRRVSQVLALCSVLLVPSVAILPQLRDRLAGAPVFFGSQAATWSSAGVGPIDGEPLIHLDTSGPGASLRAPVHQAAPVQEIVAFLRGRTAPGFLHTPPFQASTS